LPPLFPLIRKGLHLVKPALLELVLVREFWGLVEIWDLWVVHFLDLAGAQECLLSEGIFALRDGFLGVMLLVVNWIRLDPVMFGLIWFFEGRFHGFSSWVGLGRLVDYLAGLFWYMPLLNSLLNIPLRRRPSSLFDNHFGLTNKTRLVFSFTCPLKWVLSPLQIKRVRICDSL